MTALTMPARPEEDANLRPVPWRRMAWVTWRQHRIALAGVATLLGALAVYLWLTGLQIHHAYAAATACYPASSPACQNAIYDFDNAYAPTTQTIATLLLTVPAPIGAFVGAPVLARELETGTFRYAWTQGFGRWRWTVAKLVPLAIAVTAAAGVFSLLFSWYYQPLFADRAFIPLDPKLFGLRGVAFAAWTLAAFAIGALAGMLIRRVVPTIAATLAAYAGLALAAGLYLRQHYLTPLVTSNLNLNMSLTLDPNLNMPGSAWVLSRWWTKGEMTLSQATMNQVIDPIFQRLMPVVPRDEVHLYKPPTYLNVLQYLTRHGYTQRTMYQPGSRFWPFQWIEGGWLLALSVLLIAATVWLVRRRAA
jgi:ABC-type transport system involved in multi-copper enzyme maturation permease subunit